MIGSVLGNYRVVRKLGQGGMGAVYLAEHVSIGRKAAIKVLLPELSSHAEPVRRFFNEARATAQLHHPALVDIYDFGTASDGHAYLVMELLDGETLAARLAQERTLTPAAAIDIAVQIAAGLSTAHEHGIVHRDLNPSNIFLLRPTGSGSGAAERVKVLDFGIAKLTTGEEGQGTSTRSGMILGTPSYMAPEQCRGSNQVDARADIYSLGCILYSALCGRPPFTQSWAGELIAAHLYETPAPPRSLDPAIPEPLEALVLRALAKSPKERPHSMAAFGAALGEIGQTLPKEARTASPPRPAEAPAAPAPAAATLLVADLVTPARAPSAAPRRWPRVAAIAGAAAVAVGGFYASARRPRTGPGAGRAPQLIGPAEHGAAGLPRSTVDPQGRTFVAWRQHDEKGGKVYSIWANQHTSEGGWGRPQRLETDDKGDGRTVAIDALPGGGAVAVWRQSDGQRFHLWSTRFEIGPGWTKPERIDRGQGDIKGVEIATDNDGNVFVAWQQQQDEGVRRDAWVARHVPGQGWGAPTRLDQQDAGDAEDVYVSAGDGRAVVVWQQDDGEKRKDIWATHFDPERGWSVPQVIETSRSTATAPAVAMNRRGEALAIWRQSDGMYVQVWAARFEPGSGWQRPRAVDERPGDVGNPRIGIAADGRGVALWRHARGSIANIFASRFTPDGGWTAPEQLDSVEETRSHRQELAMDEDGTAIAVWQQDEVKPGIWSNRLDLAKGWRGARRLDEGPELAKEPSVSLQGGRVVASWIEACGAHECAWALLLD